MNVVRTDGSYASTPTSLASVGTRTYWERSEHVDPPYTIHFFKLNLSFVSKGVEK